LYDGTINADTTIYRQYFSIISKSQDFGRSVRQVGHQEDAMNDAIKTAYRERFTTVCDYIAQHLDEPLTRRSSAR
jgi:hypothetical protein